MNKIESVLAIDLGQSGSRVKLPSGERLDTEFFYEPKTPLTTSVEKIIKNIGKVPADMVCLSLTGLHGYVELEEELGEVCNQLTGCSQVAVCDDGLAWNLGALQGQDGAIIAAGGGAVAVARSGNKFAHIDGKGYELGDQGSSYWIGIRSLRVAIKSKEGRAPETRLVEIAEEYFGSLIDLPKKKYSSNKLHSKCIQFSERVFALSDQDKEATDILDRAALELATSAVASLKKVGLREQGSLVAPVGGLFRNNWLKARFITHLSNLDSSAVVIDPKGDALDGLLLLHKNLNKVNDSLLKWWHV